MALALWAKSAAGTKVPFLKSINNVVRVWREIIQKTLNKKVAKTQPTFHQSDALQRFKVDQYNKSLNASLKSSFTSRVFRSMLSPPGKKNLYKEAFRFVQRANNLKRGERPRIGLLYSLIAITLGINSENLIETENQRQSTILGIKVINI